MLKTVTHPSPERRSAFPADLSHAEIRRRYPAGGDDQVWPSDPHAENIRARRAAHGMQATAVTTMKPGTVPFSQVSQPPGGVRMRRGGTGTADRRLGQLAWGQMLPLLASGTSITAKPSNRQPYWQSANLPVTGHCGRQGESSPRRNSPSWVPRGRRGSWWRGGWCAILATVPGRGWSPRRGQRASQWSWMRTARASAAGPEPVKSTAVTAWASRVPNTNGTSTKWQAPSAPPNAGEAQVNNTGQDRVSSLSGAGYDPQRRNPEHVVGQNGRPDSGWAG
jgi:hypothetical protein